MNAPLVELKDVGKSFLGADGSARAVLGGVLQQQFIRLFTSLLAKFREYRDIATDNRLNPGGQIPEDATRPHRDSAHNPEIPDHPVSRQIVS